MAPNSAAAPGEPRGANAVDDHTQLHRNAFNSNVSDVLKDLAHLDVNEQKHGTTALHAACALPHVWTSQ